VGAAMAEQNVPVHPRSSCFRVCPSPTLHTHHVSNALPSKKALAEDAGETAPRVRNFPLESRIDRGVRIRLMAKITYGPTTSEARGKAADSVYTKARGGNVVKALRISAGGVGPHNLLSVTHPDTTPATPPARGSLITGQTETPNWKELPLGANGTVLGSDGTDAKWVSGTAPPTKTIILTGTVLYNTPAGCKAILVELLGAGAGGGGAATAASANGAAGGGGSGGYARKLIASPAASYTVAVGAKGTGGAAGQNDGNAGANTTWDSPATITAYGGVGGKGAAANAGTNTIYAGGAGAPTSSGADVNFPGQSGERSIKLASLTILSSGGGGKSAFGGGGQERTTAGAGNSAEGFGSGGGGAQSSNTTAYAGGDGSDGVIIVTEFY